VTDRPLPALVTALLGGAVLGATFAGWAPRILAALGVTLLILVVWGRRASLAAPAGWLFGLAFMATTLGWMWHSLGLGAWLGLVLVASLWFVVLGVGVAAVLRLPGGPCWVAATWTAVEVLRSSWPWGGVPWGRLAFATPDTPWATLLPWLGATGTTFVVALAGAALAGFVVRVRAGALAAAPCALVVAGTLAAAVLAGVVGPLGTSASGSVRVAVVQGGVPGSGTRVVAHHREVTANHAAETERLVASAAWAVDPAEFVLWPENATAVDPTEDAVARAAVERAVAAAGVPVLVGGVTDGSTPSSALNQLIVWDPAGPHARYTKQHLVPFGEYVPLRSVATRVSQRVAEIGRDMVPGPAADPLPVSDLRVATALCFDVAYDDVLASQVREGADLAAVATSNAMFLGTAQLEQQWTVTRVRGLETGRSVVVASINGISGAIGPDGSVLRELPERETTSAVVEVPLREGLTWAVRLGPWPGRLVLAVALLAALCAIAFGPLADHRKLGTDGPTSRDSS